MFSTDLRLFAVASEKFLYPSRHNSGMPSYLFPVGAHLLPVHLHPQAGTGVDGDVPLVEVRVNRISAAGTPVVRQ